MNWIIATSGKLGFARNGQEINRGDSVEAIKPACQVTKIEGIVKKVGPVSSLIKGTDGTTYLVLNTEIIRVLPKKD